MIWAVGKRMAAQQIVMMKMDVRAQEMVPKVKVCDTFQLGLTLKVAPTRNPKLSRSGPVRSEDLQYIKL